MSKLALRESAQPRPKLEKKPITMAKILGYLWMAFWVIIVASIFWHLVVNYKPDFYDKYAVKFLYGLLTTLRIVGISIVIGALLSLPLTFARMSKNKWLAKPAFGFSYLMRGTPLLAQAYLVYYGFGSFFVELKAIGIWWFFSEAENCILFIFALNTAAYQAEILRGAIENVPKGQMEGGHALGLPRWLIFWKIILPQALITALRPYGNEIILMIKGSAIASLVTVFDLIGVTRRAYSQTFDFQTYIWAAILYLLIVEALRNTWNKIEQRLTRHLNREND